MNLQKQVTFFLLFTGSITNIYSQSSLQFQEQETYLSATYQAELELSEFTLECWLMRTGDGKSINTGRGGVEAIPVISKGMENLSHESALNFFLGIRKEDGILVFDFESSLASPVPFRNNPVSGFHPLNINAWYHVAVSYDGSILRLFLNGKQETAKEIGNLPATDDTSALVIGGIADLSGQLSGKFIGKIDEMRIWNYARSQQEIWTSINREVSSVEAGLITRVGFNEGAGKLVSAIGSIAQLTFTGTGGEWAEGAPFNALIPSSCEDSAILKIGLITDPQYCDCDPSGTRIYREALKKLPVAIDSMNKFKVDFVMNLGDMIDHYYESYDSVSQFYQYLNMPYYNLLGNHEFEQIHDSLFSTILPRYGMPDFYYGFNFKNWRFLVLDGTELAAYSRILHPDLAGEGDSLIQQVQDKVNNRPWNGGIGRDQRKWIRNQIQSAHDSGQNVILFCHFPVFPDTVYLNLWNREEVIALIEDYPNVVAYINGHFHQGNYGFKKGIHYVNQAAMLDTYENNTFGVLEVYSDKLVFKGFGFNPDRILSYEDHFKAPFRFLLSDTIINTTHHAGSYIGRFYSTSETGITYSFSQDTGEYKNNYFYISHDSLFLKTDSDISVLEEIPIRVFGITCSFDTVSEVFRLKYTAPILNLFSEVETLPVFYPNPVSGTLYIRLDKPFISEPFQLIITDINGRMLKRIDNCPVDSRSGIIKLAIDSQMPAGIYLVRLTRPFHKDIYSKFIVQE